MSFLRGRTSPRRFTLRNPKLSLIVHSAAFAWFFSVWIWHTTPAAAHLPGAAGFGWFTRYLTFYSYTLQTTMLGLAVAEGLLLQARLRPTRLTRAVDDLACAIFALAHVVTLMFYTIQATTKMAVEGGYSRPPWLDVSVHALNTAVAWVDLLTARRRSFSRRAERLSSVLVAAYLSYLLLCRHMNGRFPYPFLNALPMPAGFVGVVAAALALFLAAFQAGRALSRRVQRVDSLAVEWVADAGGGCVSLRAADAAVTTGKLL